MEDGLPAYKLATEPLDDRQMRLVIEKADIIFALDSITQSQRLVFGSETLKRIVDQNESERVNTFMFTINPQTDELARLLAMVTAVKGYHD